MPSPQVVVGAVIVDDLVHPTRVLAARRSSGAREFIGRWEFPGGKVEPGETPAEALGRELAEELSVGSLVGAEIGGGWPISDRFTLRLFVVHIDSGEPTPDADHDAVRWLSADDLGSVDWLESDRAALPLIEAWLRRPSA